MSTKLVLPAGGLPLERTLITNFVLSFLSGQDILYYIIYIYMYIFVYPGALRAGPPPRMIQKVGPRGASGVSQGLWRSTGRSGLSGRGSRGSLGCSGRLPGITQIITFGR